VTRRRTWRPLIRQRLWFPWRRARLSPPGAWRRRRRDDRAWTRPVRPVQRPGLARRVDPGPPRQADQVREAVRALRGHRVRLALSRAACLHPCARVRRHRVRTISERIRPRPPGPPILRDDSFVSVLAVLPAAVGGQAVLGGRSGSSYP